MDKIIGNLKNIGGEIPFSILSYKSNTHTLYLALNPILPVFTHSFMIQHKPRTAHKSSIYIESLDTTGFFLPRNHQSSFTRNFVHSILQIYKVKTISCFAYPKPEIIFGDSSKNNVKGNLSSSKLILFWKSTFNDLTGYKTDIYSNYFSQKKYPFKSMEDIALFDDDPKRKIIKECGEVSIEEL